MNNFNKYILGDFKHDHNDRACFAAIYYEYNCRKFDSLYPIGFPIFIPEEFRMSNVAKIYGVTVKEMKEHWRCAEYILGKDPTDLYLKNNKI